jgi:hypothetical protein
VSFTVGQVERRDESFHLGHRAEVDEDIVTREREENAFSERGRR